MSNQTLTLPQVQKILKLGASAFVSSLSVKVHDDGNVEFEVDSSTYGELLAFVIIDPDGEQVANVTPTAPGDSRGFTVRRFNGPDVRDADVSEITGPEDDTLYTVAQARAREHAADVAADRN